MSQIKRLIPLLEHAKRALEISQITQFLKIGIDLILVRLSYLICESLIRVWKVNNEENEKSLICGNVIPEPTQNN